MRQPKNKIERSCHPIMKQLFQHIRDTGQNRMQVWQKAGYTERGSRYYLNNCYSPRLPAFFDLCEAAGLEVKLVPREKK